MIVYILHIMYTSLICGITHDYNALSYNHNQLTNPYHIELAQTLECSVALFGFTSLEPSLRTPPSDSG